MSKSLCFIHFQNLSYQLSFIIYFHNFMIAFDDNKKIYNELIAPNDNISFSY